MPLTIRRIGSASVNPFLFGFTCVAGRQLFLAMQKRANSNPTGDVIAQGWTLIENITADSFHNGNSGFFKISDGTEDRVNFPGGVFPKNCMLWEVASADPLARLHNQVINEPGTATTWLGGSLTPPGGRAAFVMGSILGANDAVLTMSQNGLWTIDFSSQGDGNAPHTAYVSQLVAAAAGAYNPAVNSDVAEDYRGVSMSASEIGAAGFVGEPGGGIW